MIGDFHEKPEGCQQNGELGSSNFLFSNRNDKLKKKKKETINNNNSNNQKFKC